MAGPAIMPTLPRSMVKDAAAGNSSRSTKRGVSASTDGRCSPVRADMYADIRNRDHTGGASIKASAASTPLPPASATSVVRTMRRRSRASASAPPINAVASRGANSARPNRPTASDDPVRRYI